MTSIEFVCRNKECELYNIKEYQSKVITFFNKETEDIGYKNVRCSKCGKDREVLKEVDFKGFTTNMIGKNIGRG